MCHKLRIDRELQRPTIVQNLFGSLVVNGYPSILQNIQVGTMFGGCYSVMFKLFDAAKPKAKDNVLDNLCMRSCVSV